MDAHKHLDQRQLADLVKELVYQNPDVDRLNEEIESAGSADSSYAKRLLTGQAAEHYFVENFGLISEFSDCSIVDMTQSGCGFDFKLEGGALRDFLAVEIKGLAEKSGTVTFTEKEWRVAEKLGERYYVYVVKDFCDTPFPTLIRGPLTTKLQAKRKETMTPRVSWQAVI